MTLIAPNLDDRRFQDLVDEAKRMIKVRCPEWTDQNVSDPGVTLIETFAMMVEQLIYRLNRVPDRMYIEFLNLIGVDLYGPSAARTEVQFSLTAPQPLPVHVPRGTTVSTIRTETAPAILFDVVEDLEIPPCRLERLMSSIHNGRLRDHSERFGLAGAFSAFDATPSPGDHLLLGLSAAVPRCLLKLDFDCETDGVGVDPTRPPLRWEAYTGHAWVRCEPERDLTGGLNRSGEVVIRIPHSHAKAAIRGQEAGWIRCVVTPPEHNQSPYLQTPRIRSVAAATIGGFATVEHAETFHDEIVGISDGSYGQRFPLQHGPVVSGGGPMIVEVAVDGAWQAWTAVENFGSSCPEDRHFKLNRATAEIEFGPAVRDQAGGLQAYGDLPKAGSTIRVHSYRTGGGSGGNVSAGTIRTLTAPIPFVNAMVHNPDGATGGVDAEDLASAKLRGPLLLHTRDRAVTTEDYEMLTREVAPEIVRVKCVPATDPGEAGGVRVLLVPRVPEGDLGALRYEDMSPEDDVVARVVSHLDERRVIGARVVVEPPVYLGVTVVARIRPRHPERAKELEMTARRAVYAYLNPLTGGPDHRGWPFGRPVHRGEIFAVLQRVHGTDYVEEVRLFPADLATGERGNALDVIPLDSDELIFSYEHDIQVRV